MISDKDIAEGMIAAWATDLVLGTLVSTTLVYADRVAEKTDWPNAKIAVEEGEVTRLGSVHYLREFRTTVTAETLAANADSDAIRAALSRVFGGTAADPTAGLTVPGGTVMHSLEDHGGTTPKSQGVFRLGGSDYLRVVSTFEILVHGSN